MLTTAIEKRLSGLVAWGALGVTLIVTDRIGTDPVNIGKMVLLVVIAGGSFALFAPSLRQDWKNNRKFVVTLALFLTFAILSVIFSSNPWEKGFYGTFGRNTGFLTYLALSVVFYSATLFRSKVSHEKIIKALIFTGIANLLYCSFAYLGYDIFKWNNPYKSILGTLGNPDFISAFMGIFVTALAGLYFAQSTKKVPKLIIIFAIFWSVYLIKETHAIQGYLVSATGISLVIFFYLRSKLIKPGIMKAYVASLLAGAILAIMGILQVGPLTSFLYKPSVSFRGKYWQTGLNMGFHHLFTGVGLDSFGTYFRTYRPASAVVSPGVNVTTDAAHNVFIDIFAGVGVVGFICYLVIIGFVLYSALKVYKRQKEYDPIFVIIFTTWFSYELQSFISINQIGLAVWGWLLGGTVIGYSYISIEKDKPAKQLTFSSKKPRNNSSNESTDPIPAAQALSMFLGCVMGLIIVLPPFIADAKTRTAFASQKAEAIISVANEWPKDSARMYRVVLALANSGLNQQAQSMVDESIAVFPDDYSSWYALFKISIPGSKERTSYAKKLHKLDPFNPEFFNK